MLATCFVFAIVAVTSSWSKDLIFKCRVTGFDSCLMHDEVFFEEDVGVAGVELLSLKDNKSDVTRKIGAIVSVSMEFRRLESGNDFNL